MKLLVVTNDFPPRVGGIQTYVHEILSRLDDEVIVVASTSAGAREFDAGFRHAVIRLPTGMLLPTPGVKARIANLVLAHRPDAILFGAAMPLALMGPSLQHRLGVPYATFTHGLELSASRMPIGRALLGHIGRHAMLTTAVSAWMAERLTPLMAQRGTVPVLPSGVDLERFTPLVSDAAIRARHRLEGATVVACVSRLVPRKGQDQIIRAVAQLSSTHRSLRALIVGGGPDAPRLRRLARRLRVSDRVVFAGEVPEAELPAYFRCGDIFAMPCRSRWMGLEVEALGAVFLQAAAVGRPVIAGRSGGAPEAIVDGVTGRLVDGARTDAVVRAIDALVADPARAQAMGMRGAARVRDEYHWDQIAARFTALLSEAMASR